nr:urease accessory protein UreD [Nitrospirota bacterium]
MGHAVIQAGSTQAVGRVGELVLRYERRDQATVLTHSRCTTPWHQSPPIQLDDSGSVYQPLLNPSGGLVGGDRLSLDAQLGPDTHVIVSTPSANRVYRSLSETSAQLIDLSVGARAILEWVPELTIPFAGSRYRQQIHARLEPGATLLLWDALACGRIARGERWAFAGLENEIRITMADGRRLVERYDLDGSRGPHRTGLARSWDYVASLYLVGDSVGAERWKKLEEELALILDEHPEEVLGGVSEPALPGLAVKLLARSAPALTRTFTALWAAARLCLWNRPMLELRRY